MSRRAISVAAATGTDGIAVSIDRDCTLVGASGSGTGFISTNPAATIANTITTPSVQQRSDIIARGFTSGIVMALDFPLSSGEVIFVSGSANPFMVQLFFEDV